MLGEVVNSWRFVSNHSTDTLYAKCDAVYMHEIDEFFGVIYNSLSWNSETDILLLSGDEQ